MPPIAELAYAKAQRLLAAGCVVSEFGTRRRRAFAVQDTVVAAFVRAQRDLAAAPATDTIGKLAGTSNVRARVRLRAAHSHPFADSAVNAEF